MGIELKLLDADTWDQFIAEYPQALLFHTSRWLDLLARVYALRWHRLGLYAAGRLVGLLPLQTRWLGPYRLAGAPLMRVIASTPFMGMLAEPKHLPAALAALEPVLRRWRIDHIELAFPTLLTDLQAITELGYSVEVRETITVPLAERDAAQIWGSLSSPCRRAVRKAQAEGVTVIEVENEDFIPDYYQMCREVYREAGRSPHLSEQFYAEAWAAFSGQRGIKALLAKRAEETIAGAIFLLYGGSIYYLSGASRTAGLSSRPNNLIQWQIIQWALAHHYQWYDLGGAEMPGIARFKLGLGGRRQPFTRLHRSNTTGARVGRVVYERLIRGWRRLNWWLGL